MSIVRAILEAMASRPCPDCKGDYTDRDIYFPHDKSCPRRITSIRAPREV